MIFKTIIKFIIIVALIAFLGWLGACVYSNFIATPEGTLDMPEAEKAAYSLLIKNTGGILLTNDYDVEGTAVGSRVYTLHSFWEVKGKKYVLKKADITLDEAIFGEITVRRR